jgi:signal transduction histidine kinase
LQNTLAYVGGVLLLACSLVVVAEAGFALVFPDRIGGFFLLTGFAIAALYLAGLRWWPGYVLGNVFALIRNTLPTVAWLPSVAALLVHIVGPVLAVLILRRLAGPRAAMNRLQDVGAVVAAVAVSETLITTVVTGAWWAAGIVETAHVASFWQTFLLGGVSGDFVVLPLALAWVARPLAASWREHPGEAVAMLMSVVVLSVISVSFAHPVSYLVFPALVWAALRFGPQAGTLAVAIAAAIAVWAAASALGAFAEHAPTAGTLDLRLYLTVAALMTMCLAAIVSERRRGADELRASRARLVRASDRERHKLERDLHDGAQQRLMAVQIKLQMAQEHADTELAEQLGDIRTDATEAADELRALAHGIYPPVLRDRGLADALRSRAMTARIPIRVHDDGIGRCEGVVEAAVYYCCLEAVQNAVKHAGPDVHVSIRLYTDDGLHVEIHDDGSGFDTAAVHDGIGLQNMRDRLGAVGGELQICSTPGHGTSVRGTVPDTGSAGPSQPGHDETRSTRRFVRSPGPPRDAVGADGRSRGTVQSGEGTARSPSNTGGAR